MKEVAQSVCKSVRSLLVAGVAVMLLVPVAFAATSQGQKSQPAKSHGPAYWQIGSVDAGNSTIELQKSDNSSNLVLKVTSGTRITINNRPGKLADLQGGMKVQFNASGDICSSLSVTDKSAGKKK